MIKCEICGVGYKQITSTHLKNKHGVTIEEYRRMFPESKIMSDETISFLKHKCKNQHINNKGGFGFPEGHKINEGREPSFKGETKETNEMLRKLSEERVGITLTSETKKKMSEVAKKGYRDGVRKKMYGKDNPMYGKKLTEEHVRKLHNSTREGLKKSRPEILIEEILNSYGFKYVGDRSFWLKFIGGKRKNPDFVHNKLKMVVEVYGDYWHKNDNPEDLIHKYREIGYDCMVIWESEVYKYKEGLRPSIEEFINE